MIVIIPLTAPKKSRFAESTNR